MAAMTLGISQPPKLEPMTRVYATLFNLCRGLDGDELLDQAADEIWRWAIKSVDGSWIDGRRQSEGRDIGAITVSDRDVDLRRLVLTHPDSEVSDVTWRVTVDLLSSRRGAEVACLLGRRASTPGGQLEGKHVTVPRIVRTLAAMGGTSGHLQISEDPTRLQGPDATEEFVEGVLLDPARSLPVVLFSPTPDGEYVPDLDAIVSLASGTIGVAHIFYLATPEDTFELSDRVGRPLSAWNGALRIYWPGFALSSSPYDHHVFFRNRIGPWVIEQLRRDLIARAVRRFIRPREVSELLTHYRVQLERQDLMNRLQAAENEAALVSLYEAEIDKLTETRDKVSAELEQREADINLINAERDRQADEIRKLRYLVRTQDQKVVAPEEPLSWPEPQTIEEAVLQAEDAFNETLLITKDAENSAMRINTADNPPARLWRIFSAMDEVCRRWRTDTLGTTMLLAFQELGFILKYVSDVTKGRHPDSYQFTYRAQRVSVGPHLEMSRGERVYWYNDEENRQFVINHIGQHLPDSTT